jgi:methionyl aminopeptidase
MSDDSTRYGARYMSRQQMDSIQTLFAGPQWQLMPIKSDDDVAKMKIAGAIGAHVLEQISMHVKPGVKLRDIDCLTHGGQGFRHWAGADGSYFRELCIE